MIYNYVCRNNSLIHQTREKGSSECKKKTAVPYLEIREGSERLRSLTSIHATWQHSPKVPIIIEIILGPFIPGLHYSLGCVNKSPF